MARATLTNAVISHRDLDLGSSLHSVTCYTISIKTSNVIVKKVFEKNVIKIYFDIQYVEAIHIQIVNTF